MATITTSDYSCMSVKMTELPLLDWHAAPAMFDERYGKAQTQHQDVLDSSARPTISV